MSTEPTLVFLSYSPWSAKARWALAHHEVAYRKAHYVPMLGEPALRWRMRRFTGRVTVPVWIDGSRVLDDSLDIAKEADRIGRGTPLFPEGRTAEIERWNERGERMLAVGRVRTVRAAQQHEEVRLELVPPPLRRVRPLARAMADVGLRYFVRKYGLDQAGADDEAVLREGYDALRAAVADGGTVLDGFSYADITMAMTVTFLGFPPPPLLQASEASRRRLADSALAREYADLVEWRDDLLARHHPAYRNGGAARAR